MDKKGPSFKINWKFSIYVFILYGLKSEGSTINKY